VLVAGHPDEMPVPTRIVDEINSGSTSGVNGLFWQLDPTGAQFPETVSGLAVSR